MHLTVDKQHPLSWYQQVQTQQSCVSMICIVYKSFYFHNRYCTSFVVVKSEGRHILVYLCQKFYCLGQRLHKTSKINQETIGCSTSSSTDTDQQIRTWITIQHQIQNIEQRVCGRSSIEQSIYENQDLFRKPIKSTKAKSVSALLSENRSDQAKGN